MKLKRHIKNHSLFHTFKQFKINNKSIFLINSLQLVENIYLFQKAEDDIRYSLDNTFNELTFKYFCLISIRSEQNSKICSSERGSSKETQKGGSSPFNKDKWVTCKWPICKRERAASSRLVKHWDGSRSVSLGKILCHLFSGYSSHAQWQSSKT